MHERTGPLSEKLNPIMSKNVFSKVRSEYVKLLTESRQTKSRQPIGNLYPWHCAAAVAQLLMHALSVQLKKSMEDEVCTVNVLTGTCPDHVYGGEGFELLKRFVEAGGCLKVLVWNRIGDVSRIQELAAKFKTTVEVIEAGMPVSDADHSPPHFFLVDNSAYRYEAPHPPYQASEFNDFGPEIPARICFNDFEGGERLETLFGTLWQEAKKKLKKQEISSDQNPTTLNELAQ